MPPSLARPTVQRAVHLRITPRPTTLSESREILRLLTTQFGPVEYFKNLRHDSNSLAPESAVVIFRDDVAARNCLHRSPVRFRMSNTTSTGATSGRSSGRKMRVVTMVEGEDQHHQNDDYYQGDNRGQQRWEKKKKDADVDESLSNVFAKMGLSSPAPAMADSTTLPRGPVGTPFGLGVDDTTISPPSRSSTHSSTNVALENESTAISASNTSLPQQSNQPQSFFSPLLSNSSPSNPSPTTTTNNNDNNNNSDSTSTQIYQIQANPALRHFRDLINMTRYHGSYAIDSKQLGQHDLAKRVPIIGLSNIDWRVREKPWWISRREWAKDHEGPERRRTLREIWQEGLQRQNEKIDRRPTNV